MPGDLAYAPCCFCSDNAIGGYGGGKEHVVYIGVSGCNSLTLDALLTKLVYTHGLNESRIMGVAFQLGDGDKGRREEYIVKVHPYECPRCFVEMVKQNFRRSMQE